QGDFRFDAKVYYTYYNNFIFRQATGILCGATFATCGNGIDTEFIQTIYSQRDAIFRGTEVAWQWDLVPLATGIFGVDGQYDFVRPTFAADGSNVPRMPPMRVGGGAYWRANDLVRAHGPAARLRAARPRRQRDSHRRLQPAQAANRK